MVLKIAKMDGTLLAKKTGANSNDYIFVSL
jgi:hypothetical protein